MVGHPEERVELWERRARAALLGARFPNFQSSERNEDVNEIARGKSSHIGSQPSLLLIKRVC
jgi:hypothetical protein